VSVGVDDPVELDASRSRHAARWGAVVIGVLLFGLVVLLATRDTGPRAATSELLGKPAPEVVGVDLEGEEFALAEHEGEWVLVNFFSTWCAPCVQEHPQLVSFSERHGEVGDASVVSVVFDDDPDAVTDFFEREGGDWPVLVGGVGGVPVSFGVTGVPESYLVSPDGTVVAKWISGVQASEIDATIEQLSARDGGAS
jgi:cytochrome c biogenesis protein CcmG/thiol:disulfide interchange protein DsbE